MRTPQNGFLVFDGRPVSSHCLNIADKYGFPEDTYRWAVCEVDNNRDAYIVTTDYGFYYENDNMFSGENSSRNLRGESWTPKGVSKKMTIIRLDAGQDRNGNPRRAYVAYTENGNIFNVWDEGYQGWDAIPEKYIKATDNIQTIPTTYKFYREMLKQSR